MIEKLAIHGYRSIRDLVVEPGPVTVVTGGNGSGKSSLYRALRLAAETAQGDLVGSLAHSGGLQSVLWAGPEQLTAAMRRGDHPVQGTGKRIKPVSLLLGFATDDLGYLIDVGLPQFSGMPTAFAHDPVIKREVIFAGSVMRPASTLVRRKGSKVDVRDDGWTTITEELGERDSILSEVADPNSTPEVLRVRQSVRSWRFYDGFRVDAHAPSRQPQVGTFTPVLSADGSDLAPAIQTILESAWADPFNAAIDRAFPGSRVQVDCDGLRWGVGMTQPGMLRTMGAEELSDGTLRFLLHAAALLSPRPPELMVLNEPESSLHPDLLPGLADLIAAAAERTQVVVVSHSDAIVTALLARHEGRVVAVELEKDLGETMVAGREGLLDRPAWDWGSR